MLIEISPFWPSAGGRPAPTFAKLRSLGVWPPARECRGVFFMLTFCEGGKNGGERLAPASQPTGGTLNSGGPPANGGGQNHIPPARGCGGECQELTKMKLKARWIKTYGI